MNRQAWIPLAIVVFASGCSGDGPVEFYRAQHQARSEFVDALSKIVDEHSALTVYRPYEELYEERVKRVKEAFNIYKRTSDALFKKVRHDRFDVKNLEGDDRDIMVGGIKANVQFNIAIRPTEARFKREEKRLQLLAELTMLQKAHAAIAANQPFEGGIEVHAPNLSNVLKGLGNHTLKSSTGPLAFAPPGLTKEQLLKIMSAEEYDAMQSLDADQEKRPEHDEFQPPPVPPLPQWAVDVRNQLNARRPR